MHNAASPPELPVWIAFDAPLPDPRQWPHADADGLMAVGRDLSVARLREAYRLGLFPWFNAGEPVLWWCPHPRMVLACKDFRVSPSLGKRLRQMARQEAEQEAIPEQRRHPPLAVSSAPVITTDLAFGEVIRACATRGGGQQGAQTGQATGADTWIGPSIQQTYTAWHAAGAAHSVEVWQEAELVGGLYGVCLGRMFFGESMFSRARDASKLALAYLVARLRRLGIEEVDCQQQTAHLASLGARPLPRTDFLDLLAHATKPAAPPWGRGRLLADGHLSILLP